MPSNAARLLDNPTSRLIQLPQNRRQRNATHLSYTSDRPATVGTRRSRLSYPMFTDRNFPGQIKLCSLEVGHKWHQLGVGTSIGYKNEGDTASSYLAPYVHTPNLSAIFLAKSNYVVLKYYGPKWHQLRVRTSVTVQKWRKYSDSLPDTLCPHTEPQRNFA